MGRDLGTSAMLDAHNVRPHGTFQADFKPKQHDFVTLAAAVIWPFGLRYDREDACLA